MSLHQATGHYAGDQPLDRITFDALSEFERARLRGALIIYRHVAHRTCDRLAALKRQREAERGRNTGEKRERFGAQAFALLAVMANAFGKIIPGSEGLRVDESRETIADAISGSWKSTHPLLQQLEAVGAIYTHRLGGPKRCVFDLIMPPESEQELARAAQATAQSAPVAQENSCVTEGSCAANSLHQTNLRPAQRALSCVTEGSPSGSASFPTENAHFLPSARSADSTVRTSTLTFTSTHEVAGGRGDGGNPKAGEGGDGWFAAWLKSLKGRDGEDMKPWAVKKWARHPQITPEIQHAIRYEVEHSPARDKPNFSAAGLAITFCKSPMTQLSDDAWGHAKRTLADATHRERQFTGTRVADLFGEPAASPLSTGPAEGQSIEDRAAEIQQTLARAELDALHRQACDAMPPGLQRMCVAKGDPRKLPQVHAMIVRRLAGAAEEIGAAR